MLSEKIKELYGRLFRKQIINGWRKGSLYVLNYHSTPNKYLENFEKQIQFLIKHFEFIDPLKIENSSEFEKPAILLTFDDGIKSNWDCLKLLDKYKIKAIFFVVPNFIKSSNPKEFYRQNIRFDPHEKLEITNRDMVPLSIEDLHYVMGQGHIIGHHTASHDVRNIDKWSKEKIEYEIVTSKKELEEELQTSIDYFASPIDSGAILNNKIANEIVIKYKHHFTTFPGKNIRIKKNLIRRNNVETYYPIERLITSLSNFEELRWKMKLWEHKY